MSHQGEIYQDCRGVKIMSSFDLTNSFWQMPLSEESKKFTAFTFEGRTYEFNVTPFGLKTSGASLIRGLERVLHGMRDTLTFIDDILCLAENTDQHIHQVDTFLSRLDDNNVR